jgi:hypothetical protein
MTNSQQVSWGHQCGSGSHTEQQAASQVLLLHALADILSTDPVLDDSSRLDKRGIGWVLAQAWHAIEKHEVLKSELAAV